MSVSSKTHPGAREFLLLFPYYEKGTVWAAIVRAAENGPPWPYPEPSALRTFLDACCGINAMHSLGYAHRDMKVGLLVGAYVAVWFRSGVGGGGWLGESGGWREGGRGERGGGGC